MKRVDANHKSIVEGLRSIGASVQSIAAIGKGAPDLLVGRAGRNWLLEIKNREQPPNKRRLTTAEEEWQRNWRGQVNTVHSLEEAIGILTSYQP